MDELRRLLDKQAMTEALLRYCRGVDRCDGELIAALFHPDATVHHASFRGLAPDFVRDYTSRIQGSATSVMHALANVLIDVDDDGVTARSEASFVAYLGREKDGEPLIDVFGGRYLDRWRRADGRWRVSDRVTVHDWNTVASARGHVFPRAIDAYAQGGWYPDDPVYGR